MLADPDLVLRAREATFAFGRIKAVDAVSFDIQAGESVAIVGPSGSGKTTLLKLISGTLTGAGTIELSGRLGIVYQDVKLLPWMTVAQNIALAARDSEAPPIERWIEAAGLAEKTRAFPYQLSGGQRQRVAVIRALAGGPSLLLLDEPFSALDFLAKSRLRSLIEGIALEQRLTVLTVTHDLDDATRLASRILVMKDGQLVADIALGALSIEERLERQAYIEGLF